MMSVLLIICALLIFIDIALIALWMVNFKEGQADLNEAPFVSVLLAARNEEEYIVDCLDSLVRLDYPKEQLEVIVGNDGSVDRTKEIVEAYAVQYSWISVIDVDAKITPGNGKANALAHLANKAKGDYFFITDADITVPTNWIWGMLKGMDTKVGLVTGTSVVEGKGWLARYQRIDWLFATGMLKVVSDLGIPVTSMGNNMMVRKKSYFRAGGYEKLPFSVTEDLELFKKVKEVSKVVNLFGPEVLNVSKPIHSWENLLIQRKRWMQGAFGLPLLMIFILLAQTLAITCFVGLAIMNITTGLGLLALHFILRFAFVNIVARKVNREVNLIGSFVYELTNSIFMFTALWYYLFSGPVEWKGRKY